MYIVHFIFHLFKIKSSLSFHLISPPHSIPSYLSSLPPLSSFNISLIHGSRLHLSRLSTFFMLYHSTRLFSSRLRLYRGSRLQSIWGLCSLKTSFHLDFVFDRFKLGFSQILLSFIELGFSRTYWWDIQTYFITCCFTLFLTVLYLVCLILLGFSTILLNNSEINFQGPIYLLLGYLAIVPGPISLSLPHSLSQYSFSLPSQNFKISQSPFILSSLSSWAFFFFLCPIGIMFILIM